MKKTISAFIALAAMFGFARVSLASLSITNCMNDVVSFKYSGTPSVDTTKSDKNYADFIDVATESGNVTFTSKLDTTNEVKIVLSGGTPGEGAPTDYTYLFTVKTVEIEKTIQAWNSEEAKKAEKPYYDPNDKSNSTIRIVTHIVKGSVTNRTPNVLFIGTLCGRHSLTNGTVATSLRAANEKANLDYYLFEDNTVKKSGENIAPGDPEKKIPDNFGMDETLAGKTGKHYSLNGMLTNLYDICSGVKSNHYDYIIFEFDGSRIGEGYGDTTGDHKSDSVGDEKERAVAKWLKPYYDEKKVIWALDNGFDWDRSQLLKSQCGSADDKMSSSYLNELEVESGLKAGTKDKDLLCVYGTRTTDPSKIDSAKFGNIDGTAWNSNRLYVVNSGYLKNSNGDKQYMALLSETAWKGVTAMLDPNLRLGYKRPTTNTVDIIVRESGNPQEIKKNQKIWVGQTYENQVWYDDADTLGDYISQVIKPIPYDAVIADSVVQKYDAFENMGLSLPDGADSVQFYEVNEDNWKAGDPRPGTDDTKMWKKVTTGWGVDLDTMTVTAKVTHITSEWWNKIEIHVRDDGTFFPKCMQAGRYEIDSEGNYLLNPNDGEAVIALIDASGKTLVKKDGAVTPTKQWVFEPHNMLVTYEDVEKDYDGISTNIHLVSIVDAGTRLSIADISTISNSFDEVNWFSEDAFKDLWLVNATPTPAPNVYWKIVAPGYNATNGTNTVTINKRKVTVTSGDRKKVYDGIAATNWSAKVTSELDFLAGDDVSYTYTGTQTDVGVSSNNFSCAFDDPAVERNYDVTLVTGELEVTKARIVTPPPGDEPPTSGPYTQAPNIVRIYDGTGSNIEPTTENLVAGNEAIYQYSTNKLDWVEWKALSITNVVDQQKVWYRVRTETSGTPPAENYFAATNYAFITITQRVVTVKANDASKPIGTNDPEWSWDFDWTATDIAKGETNVVRSALSNVVHLARCSKTGSFNPQDLEEDVAKYTGVITTNEPFAVQTDLPLRNYRLAFKPGDFEITAGAFAIQATEAIKTYDGNPTNATVSVTVDSKPGTTGNLTSLAVSYSANKTGPWTEPVPYDPTAFKNVTNLWARFVATKTGYVTPEGHLAATSAAQVVINPLKITVKANNASKPFGANDPEWSWDFDWTATDIAKGETYVVRSALSNVVHLARCSKSGSFAPQDLEEDAGTYTGVITTNVPFAVQKDLPLRNYRLAFKPGDLTITERPKLKIYVADTSVVYGADVPTNSLALRPVATRYDPANPDPKKIYGEDKVKFMTTYVKWAPVGTYTINTNSADITSDYYDITVVPGKLTVTPETIETIPHGEEPEPPASGRPWVWAPDIVKCYDGESTNTTAHVYGLHEGNEPTFRYSTSEKGPWKAWKDLQFTDVSTNKVWYSVTTKDGAGNANYFAATNFAWVTITQRWITVTAQDYTRKPGDPNPTNKQIKDECELSEELIPGNEIVWEAKCTYVGEEIGTHEGVMVPYGEESQGNYRVAYVPGNLTITDKTPLKIFIADRTVTYGDPVPADLDFRPVETRYECAEEVDRRKIFGEDTVSFGTDYTQGSPAGGKYAIFTNSADVTSTYYAITIVRGKLTVLKEKIDTPPPGDVPPAGTGPWTWAPNIVRCYDGEGTNINPVTENLLPGNVPSYLYSLDKNGAYVPWEDLQLTNVVFDAKGRVTSNRVWYAVTTKPANYFAATNFAWVTITQRVATVEAKDARKVYGSADPEFGWDLVDAEGTVVAREIPAVRAALTAEINRIGLGRFNEAGGLPAEEAVGAYKNVVSTNAPFAAYTRGVLANYRLAFLRGDFAISPAQIVDDPTESARPWARAIDVVVWTNDCPEVTTVGTNILVKTGLWSEADDRKAVLKYSMVDPAVAKPSDWSDSLKFTKVCRAQVWCNVSCENYLPTNVTAFVTILSKAADVVDEDAEAEDKPLPNPKTTAAVSKVLDGIVANAEILETGDPNPNYDPNLPGWRKGQLDGRVCLAFTSIANIRDEAARRAAENHMEETARNYKEANPNVRNFKARSVDVKLAYAQAFGDSSLNVTNLIGDTNAELIPFTLAVDLSENRQVLQVTRYHRGEVKSFESGEGYAVNRNVVDPSASTITVTARYYSEFIILTGEPYTPPQPTPPGGCEPAEPEDGLVWQFRAQLYTTRGVVQSVKSQSVCAPDSGSCVVLRGKDRTVIDGWLYSCARTCSGLQDCSAVLWDSYRKARVAEAAFETKVLNIMGARNTDAEWAWTLTGTTVYDSVRQQSFELQGAGYGTFSASYGLFVSFSGYVAGVAGASYDLKTKNSAATCICEPSQILTCESYDSLDYESVETVMFGRWKMKCNKAASTAYGKSGTLKLPSYARMDD